MTGQPYTIKEMKSIVDYLNDNKLYGETKGRKMWMEYASSQLTTRTWQSLKETFLKRVLPDLHNPYYNLTIEQINSFRSGYDIKERNKNKLEIHTVSDDSDGSQNDLPQTNNGNDKEQENKTGEAKKSSKIALRSRSSADTVIVDTCYETAEDIQKELESPVVRKENGETKSLRDCIQYSEPLTPMLQEVLDDFQSEPENEPEASDRENQLQIVEQPDIENLENISNEVSKIVSQNNNDKSAPVNPGENSEKDAGKNASADGQVDKNLDQSQTETIPDNQTKREVTTSGPEIVIESESEALLFHDSDHEEKNEGTNIEESTKTTKGSKEQVEKEQTKAPVSVTSSMLNNSTTPDASLPNNPEALKKRVSNEDNTETSEKKDEKTVTRKRVNSESAAKVKDNKKSKLDIGKNKANSENESKRADKPASNMKSRSVEPIGKQKDNEKTKSKKTAKLEDLLEKPSTSKSIHVEKKPQSETEQKTVRPETKNPCLNNLSLFSYNSSGSSDIDQNKKKDSEINKKTNEEIKRESEIVRINSHTESDVEEVNTPPKKKQRAGVNVKLDKERGLANVFGFSSGAAHSKRKRRLSRRKRTLSQTLGSQNNVGSNSSEWTSESGSEAYVSPPRSRKNRPSKKYLKPHSARIHSLEEEGGLFVMYGRKIYPLVKDGKLVKHYLSYQPESESDEENYWKLKYVEEKKRSAELKKLLQESKGPKASTSKPSPALRDRTPTIDCDQPQDVLNNDGALCLPVREEKKEAPKVSLPENIKIKFTTKNDQEIHLEGNWNQLQNALDHVVHIFHKEPEPISKPKALIREPSSSGITSPVDVLSIEESAGDPDTHEKVDKIEYKIFKEIEEMDKKQRLPSEEVTNVTKRRGRRDTVSSSTSESISKRIKTSERLETPKPEQETPKPEQETPKPEQETPETEQIPIIQQNNTPVKSTPVKNKYDEVPIKRLRTPRKTSNESPNTVEVESSRTTRKSTLKVDANKVTESIEDQEIRYMLPPENKKRISKTTEKKPKPGLKRSMPDIMKIYTAAEIASQNFVDSTQGYQDSDASPMQNELRKKKRLKISVMKTKYLRHLRRSTRNKPSPFIYYDDSSVSSTEMLEQKGTTNNSTNNTEVYRSESYQILMNRTKQPVVAIQRLSSIDERHVVERLDSTEKNEVNPSNMNIDNFSSEFDQMNGDIGSSSQISLPLSPELSVVENLSISQDMLNTIKDQAAENEMEYKDINTETGNQLMTSDVVPLSPMELGCTQSCQLTNETEPNVKTTHITDSLLNQVRTFKIEDQNNLTDTLDLRLRDLLLESAKKIVSQHTQVNTNHMDIDVSYKIKPKKRCSTPRKRTDSQKSKNALKIQNVIEEEHIHNCSLGGRKSCPPIIETVPIMVDEELNISTLTIEENVKSKGRKKKDVIKVKITRPKVKKPRHNVTEQTKDIIKDSVTKAILCNDSGINNTESGDFLAVDETVDLIHNHSDTCLQTNECIGDSVEFVDNSLKTLLTLSDSQSHDSTWRNQDNFNDDVDSADFFSNDAQDVRSFYKSKQDPSNDSDTEYHSPLGTGPSSLITEDLSDEISPPITRFEKWYLLSEDETTNNNIANNQRTINASFGSNLKQIFPIACAVPDLSTITEMSKDNEDSNQRSTVESLANDGLE